MGAMIATSILHLGIQKQNTYSSNTVLCQEKQKIFSSSIWKKERDIESRGQQLTDNKTHKNQIMLFPHQYKDKDISINELRYINHDELSIVIDIIDSKRAFMHIESDIEITSTQISLEDLAQSSLFDKFMSKIYITLKGYKLQNNAEGSIK